MASSNDIYLRTRSLSDHEFERLSEFISGELGIKMPHAKKSLLESRLQKRLRHLGLSTFTDYCDYLFSPGGMDDELVHMIDLVTTNKTDFFRESEHFDFLMSTALPALVKECGSGVKRTLVCWSAGCSTGEEPYTIAMVMSEFKGKYPGLGFDYNILATDISTRVLAAAHRGVYTEEKVDPVPPELRRKYFLKSKDKNRGLVRVVPELRQSVRYRRVNFKDQDFGFREKLDIIFCRNVVIYFDRDMQRTLFGRFCDHLSDGGYLFIGHSETLSGFDLPLKKVAPSIYRKA